MVEKTEKRFRYVKVSLDDDQWNFIERVKEYTGATKTAIISAMIRYFMSNPSKLYMIEGLIVEEHEKRIH